VSLITTVLSVLLPSLSRCHFDLIASDLRPQTPGTGLSYFLLSDSGQRNFWVGAISR